MQPGVCALMGANGAGKSTLLRLLSGLEKTDSGSLLIGGLDFQSHAVEIRRNLGVLPERLGLFESLTVIDNLRAIGSIYGLPKSETEARAADLLELLDLTQGRHTRTRDCSFGMRKKTALAMALLPKPGVLLLDEPFEGLDPASSDVVELLLRQLASNGATLLLASHSLPIVQKIATRVIILHAGKIASDSDATSTVETIEDRYFRIVGKAQSEVPNWLRS